MGFLTTSDPYNTEGSQESADSLPSSTNISFQRKPDPPAEAGITGCVTDFHVTVTKAPVRTNLRDKYSVSLDPASREGMMVGTRGHSCSHGGRLGSRARSEVGVGVTATTP